MSSNFLQMLLQSGGINPGMFQNLGAGLTANDAGMLTVDPLTGLPIDKKNQRSKKSFIKNPRQIMPGNALDFNVPQWSPTGNQGAGLGAGLMKILGGAK